MGKPENTADYEKYRINEVDAYIKSDVKAKDDSLKIKYSKMLWMEKLVVEGIIF